MKGVQGRLWGERLADAAEGEGWGVDGLGGLVVGEGTAAEGVPGFGQLGGGEILHCCGRGGWSGRDVVLVCGRYALLGWVRRSNSHGADGEGERERLGM